MHFPKMKNKFKKDFSKQPFFTQVNKRKYCNVKIFAYYASIFGEYLFFTFFTTVCVCIFRVHQNRNIYFSFPGALIISVFPNSFGSWHLYLV